MLCIFYFSPAIGFDGLQFSEKQIQVQRKPPDMQLLR